MKANPLPYLVLILLSLHHAPSFAQEKDGAKSKEKARLEKAWLKPFERTRKAHEEAFSKARKDQEPLEKLHDAWLAALEKEEARAQKEMKAPRSKVIEVAKTQYDKMRFERLRLLLSLRRKKAAEPLLRALVSNSKSRLAARRLQIAYARRDDPAELRAVYSEILKERSAPFSTHEGPKFHLPPQAKAVSLVWIWTSSHPLGRHKLDEYARVMTSFSGQVFALSVGAKKSKAPKAVTGVRDFQLKKTKPEPQATLCLSSTPLLLLFDKAGRLALVDPTVKELDAWLRSKRKEP